MNFLSSFFKLDENKTSIRTEVVGGLTTFMTMSYILFVNPSILSKAGIPFQDTVTATAWAAGFSTLLMGLVANFPIALASGMGLNAALTYNIVIGMGLSWQVGMGVIVIEGAIITILVLTHLREMAMDSIPLPLKRAIGIGIGIFIAFIGLKEAGFITAHPATFVTAGKFSEKAVWLSSLGLCITVTLLIRKVRGAILWGMLGSALLALFMGLVEWPERFVSFPNLPKTFLQCDIAGALRWDLIPVLFSFLMVDFFDTMGTVIAVGEEGNFMNKDGRIPRLKKILLIDSLAAMIGGLFSASSVTCYVESATGVAQGARTGLAAVVVAMAFFLASFLTPLVQVVSGGIETSMGTINPITAPALITVGFLMMRLIKDVNWGNLEESFPSFLVMIGMPLTFSISHGIGLGFISYCLIKILQGKYKEIPIILYPISILFALTLALS